MREEGAAIGVARNGDVAAEDALAAKLAGVSLDARLAGFRGLVQAERHAAVGTGLVGERLGVVIAELDEVRRRHTLAYGGGQGGGEEERVDGQHARVIMRAQGGLS